MTHFVWYLEKEKRYEIETFSIERVLNNLKKLYGPFLWMGFNWLKATATSRRQFTFYHSVPRNSWYSFYRPRKDKRLSRPWSHPVVLSTGPLIENPEATFLWKSYPENVNQKLVPDPFLILVYTSKQSLNARNYFKNKIFSKRIIKMP